MATMTKLLASLICVFVFLAGCGPKTIVLRPELDTPSHHVSNGRKLLDRGKIEAAFSEFSRAKELDPEYPMAYVGLGLVSAHRGDFVAGRHFMLKADKLAVTDDEKIEVEEGYRMLNHMETKKAP